MAIKVLVPEIKFIDKIELDKRSTALIIVDMQNDFVHPKGKLYVPDAQKTIPVIKELLQKARKNEVKIFFTKDTHYHDDPEYEIWGEHVQKGTWGWEIVEDLTPQNNEIVIEKTRYDAFYGTPLDDLLRVYGVKNLIVVGTVANICVLHTVSSASLRWYNVVVPIDGISALNEFDYYLALRQIYFLYRGKLLKSSSNILFK